MPEVKPCPFCGSAARWHHDYYGGGGDYRADDQWFIGCSNMNCPCDLGWHRTEHEAIAVWNQRYSKEVK